MRRSPTGCGVGDHVVLIGMMGTGKTTVGLLVAERLGRRFLDSDEQLPCSDK